jgi:hypothetical protein
MADMKLERVKASAAVVVASIAFVSIIVAMGEFKGQVRSQGQVLARHEITIAEQQRDIRLLCERIGAIEASMSRIIAGQERIYNQLDRIGKKLD